MAKMTLKAMEAELNEWGVAIRKSHSSSVHMGTFFEAKAIEGAAWEVEGITWQLAWGFKRSEVVRMAYAEMQKQMATPVATAPQVEPAAPVAEIVVPDVLAEKNQRIAELEAENAKLKSDNERLSALCMKAMRKLAGGGEVTAYKSLREATVMPQPTPAQEAPKPQRMASRMHVNWNNQGFSSGDYEVLAFSREKGIVYLNITTDPAKPMPKAFYMTDCQ